MKETILIGFSGHAKVVLEALESAGGCFFGYLESENFKIPQFKYLGSEKENNVVLEYSENKSFHIAIGNNEIRRKIANTSNLKDVDWQNILHQVSLISKSAILGKGNFVSAGVVVNASTKIGDFNIINTKALIEHDNSLGDFCHISPGSVLCGGVSIKNNVQVGANATVLENVSICSDVIIGAGAVVTKNINESGTYVGVPAKRITKL